MTRTTFVLVFASLAVVVALTATVRSGKEPSDPVALEPQEEAKPPPSLHLAACVADVSRTVNELATQVDRFRDEIAINRRVYGLTREGGEPAHSDRCLRLVETQRNMVALLSQKKVQLAELQELRRALLEFGRRGQAGVADSENVDKVMRRATAAVAYWSQLNDADRPIVPDEIWRGDGDELMGWKPRRETR